jgi:hypothetical protein
MVCPTASKGHFASKGRIVHGKTSGGSSFGDGLTLHPLWRICFSAADSINPQSTYVCRVQCTQQCLGSSKILTPHPLSTQRVCPPPAPKAHKHECVTPAPPRRTHPPGGEGVGGQYFGRRQTLDWPVTVVCNPSTSKPLTYFPPFSPPFFFLQNSTKRRAAAIERTLIFSK